MRRVMLAGFLGVYALLGGCSGGGGGEGGSFFLVEFLESGKDNIPRNRVLTFNFSQPVAPVQDFPERLKIENVVTTPGKTNFARAVGTYIVNAEIVTFVPRLPTRPDRSDAGFRADADYHVFVKGGADALRSATDDPVSQSADLTFNTNTYFEDPVPASPPRALGLTAVDTVSDAETNLGRMDPRPQFLALLDNATLLDGGRAIEPGAGGSPGYATPWQFNLRISEPIDPTTVITQNIVLYEIRNDAFDGPTLPSGPNTVSDGYFGTAVGFKVPVNVSLLQSPILTGGFDVFIRVSPLQTLVDDARYRLSFGGNILGIDFRKTFIGDNGLTGDGTTLVGGGPYAEVGGLGYVTEFLVFDRPAITRQRRLEYDPLVDNIRPEDGTTTTDPAKLNSALYNPSTDPGRALGFLSAFGDGRNGNLAASGGNTVTVSTGDTPNAPMGNPFTVTDLNPNNDYRGNPLPGGPLTYDTPTPFELQVENLTVSSASTLRFTGVNPVILRVRSVVQLVGTLSLSGSNGQAGGGAQANGGAGGAGGFAGGSSKQGSAACSYYAGGSCVDFTSYLSACSPANTGFPDSFNGNGPGRGYAGGEAYVYYATDNKNGTTGTGGGGASHATAGSAGEDRQNAGAAPGSAGPSCSTFTTVRNSSVIGVRGQPGPIYGDRAAVNVLLGGSGGGAGGATHTYNFGTSQQAGGAGGGGGGSLTVISAGPIISAGGRILATGGAGGRGNIKSGSSGGTFSWDSVSGGGGGGAGGLIALISGDDINLTAAALDTSGGAGGARGNTGTAVACNSCNAGGAGGKGFIFLMDADGQITGFVPSSPGNYDSFATGVLTISAFDASRFSSISAITQLFPSLAANPDYQAIAPSDIVGNVNPGQFVHIFMSSARSDPDEPLLPDPATESLDEEIALVSFSGGSTVVTIVGSMDALNPSGPPNRDAFVRVRASFEYNNGVEAALGPFATMDRITITYRFNG